MSRKRYWLLPLVIFAGTLAAIIYLAQRRAALAPFVYSQAEVSRAQFPTRG
jgi:hypothetical protein